MLGNLQTVVSHGKHSFFSICDINLTSLYDLLCLYSLKKASLPHDVQTTLEILGIVLTEAH